MVVTLKTWMIAVIAIAVILIFLGGYILGKLGKRQRSSGRLIIDEKGEKELWTFMLDDDIESVKKQRVIFLDIEKRA